MNMYFEQNKWEPFVYQRLNELIDEYRRPTTQTDQNPAYVVFDFDETSIMGDIEDNLIIYMIERLLFKLSPEDLQAQLATEDYPLDLPVSMGADTLIPRELVGDIIEAYTWLWEHYIQVDYELRPDLEHLKLKKHYLSFRAKLWYYYKMVQREFQPQLNRTWPLFFFSGYTQLEMEDLCRDMLMYMHQQPVRTNHYYTDSDLKGKTGAIYSYFISGLAYPEELITLFQALEANGIIVYVVSSSPVDVVRIAASEYYFQIPRERVYGLCYRLDAQGKILPYIEEDSVITSAEGKVTAIRERIAPLHEGQDPIIVFGDSSGDYAMLTQMEQVKLGVIFNLLRPGTIQELVKLAMESYGQPQARFVLQGRNNNKLRFIDYPGTVPFGKKNPQIYAS